MPHRLPIFSINKSIVDGPLSIPINTDGIWRYELQVTNISRGRVCNVVLANIINLSLINEVNFITISKGSAIFIGSNVIWSVGNLKAGETVKILVEISGSFTTEGTYHLGEANVSGLDPILDTIVGEPVRGFDIVILPV